MQITIKPSTVNGIINAPASKSVAQRAIALASLAKGTSEIYHYGTSDDVLAAINVCRALGAKIELTPEKLIVEGGIQAPMQPLHCGESGLGIRIFSCLAATLSEQVVLTGDGTLTTRPMETVENAIRALGGSCQTQNGRIPITVCGPMKGGFAKVDGSLSSQVLSGLLMAAPLAQMDTTILVDNLQSKPYIDLTLETMKAFGVDAEHSEYKEFRIKAQQNYEPAKFAVEGDWSGAAFLLVAGAIAGKVRVENLNPMSKQADKKIIEALMFTGASVSLNYDFIEVSKGKLKPFHFDATHCPDLFPPLVALAAHCSGESRILGVSRLQDKESNRAIVLKQEFAKLGVKIEILGEMMSIFGGTVAGGHVTAHHDHRIAMACAVAALACTGFVEIEGAEAVGKSYPEFFDDLRKLNICFVS
jgi:3-phosphoshikimate 1-carboxyvinyltransferase